MKSTTPLVNINGELIPIKPNSFEYTHDGFKPSTVVVGFTLIMGATDMSMIKDWMNRINDNTIIINNGPLAVNNIFEDAILLRKATTMHDDEIYIKFHAIKSQ